MNRKKVRVVLSRKKSGGGDSYRVERVTNSMEPKPGTWLEEYEAKKLVDNPNTEVVIKD